MRRIIATPFSWAGWILLLIAFTILCEDPNKNFGDWFVEETFGI